jgi:hypothetical protein
MMAGLGRSIAIAPFRDHGSVKHRAKEILAGRELLAGFQRSCGVQMFLQRIDLA